MFLQMKKILVPQSCHQTKDWRKKQYWYKNGKSNEFNRKDYKYKIGKNK